MNTKSSRVWWIVVAVAGFLCAPSARPAPVSLTFQGTTLASDSPFVAGDPFSLSLTYDTTAPKSSAVGPDGSGSWYQGAVANLAFNYNAGAYIGTTASADIMIFHGPTYGHGTIDEFWVTTIAGEGFPAIGDMGFSPVNSAFGVEAPYGVAFADSSLPTTLSTPPFVCTSFELVWLSYATYQSVHFNGIVNSVVTVPEPSSRGLLVAAMALTAISRKRTTLSRD